MIAKSDPASAGGERYSISYVTAEDDIAGERTCWRFASGAAAWGIRTTEGTFPEDPAQIESMGEGQVVVLIDEYDKPLLGHLMTPRVTEFRNALKAFYSVLKTFESKQRFTFITGVSKFSKVSIFSDLNNLKDYTLESVVATLFGVKIVRDA